MFFNIGSSELDNFPVHYKHQNLVINLDSGWHTGKDKDGNVLWYKGYIDDRDIHSSLNEIAYQEEPLLYGNFCLLKCFDKGISIKTDRLRSFPMWYNKEEGITNLVPREWSSWTDSFVMITDAGELVESKFRLIPTITSRTLTLNKVVSDIDAILTRKIKQFAENNRLPLKVFLSGGIDTGLLYSYIVKLDIPHELITSSHTDYDYFYLKNHHTLSAFWGYKQFHYWKEDCVLLSGAPGDEFTVRSPTTANMMLKYYGSSIPTLLNDGSYSDSLHHSYFDQPKYHEMWDEQKNDTYRGLTDAIEKCLNLIVNDYQHWHLGNTISWTPLRDIEIFKTIACLDLADLKMQIMDSVIQKRLIIKNCPELLQHLSTQKNSKNSMENLVGLVCK